ncbi:hypothetical protein LCGC14_3107650, partial [marine sediment metagenome]
QLWLGENGSATRAFDVDANELVYMKFYPQTMFAIAKAEYEMCAGCSNLGTKWEHLKNPEAREAFYHKADQIIAICEEELKVGNALTAELTEEGVKISIDSICKRERKNELERIMPVNLVITGLPILQP